MMQSTAPSPHPRQHGSNGCNAHMDTSLFPHPLHTVSSCCGGQRRPYTVRNWRLNGIGRTSGSGCVVAAREPVPGLPIEFKKARIGQPSAPGCWPAGLLGSGVPAAMRFVTPHRRVETYWTVVASMSACLPLARLPGVFLSTARPGAYSRPGTDACGITFCAKDTGDWSTGI